MTERNILQMLVRREMRELHVSYREEREPRKSVGVAVTGLVACHAKATATNPIQPAPTSHNRKGMRNIFKKLRGACAFLCILWALTFTDFSPRQGCARHLVGKAKIVLQDNL